ncbi:putative ser thr protein phosphatase family [Erysiphe necator]|uniref:Putative ser thr protein phosphatase family n=1 Tax=Uncinula necator TaxID=52586 RepID=A0A0B1P042_UNCNE|nr:putative ser thr protein phosphatase family [Erysiphe necator]
MPLKEYELQTIYQAIRSQNKDTPIQVFGSHTHIRNFVKYDSKAAGLQSGRYLETIGWASINGVKNNSQFGAADEVSFHRRYIDNNILGFRYHTGLSASEFPTEHGKNTTSYITKVRHRLGLDQKYGCIPRDLYYSRSPFPGNDTIAAWMAYELLPGIAKKQFNQPNVTTFFMVNCGFMRSNLYQGPFLHDTSFTLTPFQDKIAVIRKVPYKAAVDISKRGLWDVSVFHEKLLSRSISYEQTSLRSRNFEPNNTNRDQPSVDNKKISTSTNSSTLLRGYITTDDGGSDGDDTLYSHLGAVVKPPPFMTAVTGLPDDGEPEYVDLAFNSFLTSMMLILLQNKGHDFDKSKVEYHSDEQIRDMISMWVKDNWIGNC